MREQLQWLELVIGRWGLCAAIVDRLTFGGHAFHQPPRHAALPDRTDL
jgi:hypothetical protein